jgi:hypothetical protein
MYLHIKNKAIIAKNKKVSEDDQKLLLIEKDIDKDWVSPDWCMWKINFDCLLFSSLRNTKETDGGDYEEVDSEGDDNDASNDDIHPHKKLKTAKKTLRSIISKSPTRKKQKELMKKRKANYNKTKQTNTARKQ